MSISTDWSSELTPSELLIYRYKYNGALDRSLFANLRKPMMNILATAFLSNVKLGAITLKQEEDTFLKVFKYSALFVKNNNNCKVSWPKHSLENYILESSKNRVRPGDIVYSWLERDSSTPWESALKKVTSGLAKRNLINEKIIEDGYFFKTTYHLYEFPESTLPLINESYIDTLEEMLAFTKKSDPEMWKNLYSELDSHGVKRRTIQSSGGGGSD